MLSKREPRVIVRPLLRADASRVRLPWDSHFSAATLRMHLEENPNLAFWNPATGEYAVGGRWRARRDIGMVIESSPGASREALVDQLVACFSQEGFRAATLSQDEVDAAAAWYRQRGWGLLDRLLVFRITLKKMRLAEAPPMAVCTFQPEDLAALTELDRAAFPWLWWNEPADFLAYANSSHVDTLVAWQDGKIAGYVSYSIRNVRGHLDRLAVDPSIQRRGYGSSLLTLALQRMREASVEDVSLTTQEANLVAQRLYKHFGFCYTGETHEIRGMRLPGS